MRQVVQTFATSLLDHVRTSEELEIILNHDSDEHFQSDDRQSLSRLKLAIKVRLKMVRTKTFYTVDVLVSIFKRDCSVLVCRPSKCTTATRHNLVQRFTRIQRTKHVLARLASGENRRQFRHIQRRFHDSSEIIFGVFFKESVH